MPDPGAGSLLTLLVGALLSLDFPQMTTED